MRAQKETQGNGCRLLTIWASDKMRERERRAGRKIEAGHIESARTPCIVVTFRLLCTRGRLGVRVMSMAAPLRPVVSAA